METLLHYAASELDANMLYGTHFHAPDPFVFLEHQNKRYLIASDLELGRAKKESSVDEVIAQSEIEAKLPADKKQTADVIARQLENLKIKQVWVPANFGLALAEDLRARGIEIKIKRGQFFAQRVAKTDQEVEFIRQALKATGKAMMRIRDVIGLSQIDKQNRLVFEGNILTSEKVKEEVAISLLKENYIASHTIVAGGAQGSDPHNTGSGPLLAGQSIICDLFPRSQSNFYWGDMTRTFCKGRASNYLKKKYEMVKEGQEIAFKSVKAGINGQTVHQMILDYFAKEGFENKTLPDGTRIGFIHGTGHGLGLDIHEAPSISIRESILPLNTVVTVEPGHYEPECSVRLEDVVLVKEKNCINLTEVPKELEIE
jgi:Xaa-Pro aminopeptidase